MSELIVSLNQMKVGVLKKRANGSVSFQYDKNWLEHGFLISYSLPLQEQEFKGDVVTRYFDNLLPDHEQIKKHVATQFGANSTAAFDLLSAIGRDCVGALTFSLNEEMNSLKMQSRVLSEQEIANKLENLHLKNPLGMQGDDFRLSIAGAQEKTALLYKDNKWHEPLGLTATSHIFKTSIGAMGVQMNFDDSIDNEWFSLQVMQHFGLKVCKAQIECFNEQRALVIERFDRRWVEWEGERILVRIPQEDLCQALGYSSYQKYQSDGGPGIQEIEDFLRASSNSEDRKNFFKAIMIFDLLQAPDGHAKNFSIRLSPSGFKLTPFYDVMSGYFLTAREEGMSKAKLKLAMKVGNSGHYALKRITLRHYQESAKLCKLSDSLFEQCLEEIREGLQKINDIPRAKNLNHQTADLILEGIHKRSHLFMAKR